MGRDGDGFFEPDAGEEWPHLPPDVAVEQLGEEDNLALGVGRVVLDNLHMEAVLRSLAANLQELGVLRANPSRRVLTISEIVALIRKRLGGLGLPGPVLAFVAEALDSAETANKSRHRVVHDRWFPDSGGQFGIAGWRQARQTPSLNRQIVGRDFLDLWEAWEAQFEAGWALTSAQALIGTCAAVSLTEDEAVRLVDDERRRGAIQAWPPPPVWHENAEAPPPGCASPNPPLGSAVAAPPTVHSRKPDAANSRIGSGGVGGG